MTPGHEHELLRAHVAGATSVEVAAAAVAGAAGALGFPPDDVARLRGAVTAVCAAAVEHGYDDPADAELDVVLVEGGAGVALRVTDRGMPFSGLSADGLAPRLSAAAGHLVQHVAVAPLPDGTSVELQVRPAPEVVAHLAAADDVGTEPVVGEPRLTVGALRREDAESLARCVWRVYRFTYVADYLYHPDRVRSLVERGWLRSWVARDDSGEVVAHLGLIFEEPGARVADASLALADPRFRHHHILEDLSTLMHREVERSGVVGTFVEAVTAHTITQRGMVRTGGIETGILLGFIPATMSYRGIAEDLGGIRQSAVLGYHAVRPTPGRPISLPERYADEVRRIVGAAGLDRTEVPPAAATGPSVVRVAVEPPRSLATVVVHAPGHDVVEVVDRHRRELCASGTQVVHLELPLGDPGTAWAVDALVERGFFWAGVIPELRDGDVLRLQYLDVDIDPSVIRLHTDEARRLLRFVLDDRRG